MNSKLFCKHCKQEVIGPKNLARVYYKLEDDSIEEVYLVHIGCVPSYLGQAVEYEKGSGEILCDHCKKGISGEAIIGYKYEDDYVEDYTTVHKACLKPFKLARAGKAHKCPKCNGTGIYKINATFVAQNDSQVRIISGAELHDKPGVWASWKVEKWKEEPVPCPLCKGDGFLEKEPIPVITDWKLAP